MNVSPYYTNAADRLQSSPQISALGFQVEVWGSGADRHDLLQVKKPHWRLEAIDADRIGYKGIEVHYESCRPGHWAIHCELWPRLGKRQKAQALQIEELLELKGGITELLREHGREAGWAQAFGAHLKRTKPDPRDPSSLIVYTFDLGLKTGHPAAEFVGAVLPIIGATAPAIDEIVIEPGGAARATRPDSADSIRFSSLFKRLIGRLVSRR